MQAPEISLFQMATGLWLSKCLSLAAELALSDHIHSGLTSIDSLAQATGAQTNRLYRVMRALAAVGVYQELPSRSFALTPIGDLLRQNHPASMNALLRIIGSDEHYRAWAHLEAVVMSDELAVQISEKQDLWSYFRENPARAAVFQEAMRNFSQLSDRSLAEAFPYGDYVTICDVGGGFGSQLLTILEANPNMRGILFDQDYVVAQAKEHLLAFAQRVDCQAGDFFRSIPNGADLYFLKTIIHDWDDESALRILQNIRAVIPSHGRLLLAEAGVAPPNVPDAGKWIDLNMMMMTGGMERTIEEFTALFAASGFRLIATKATRSPLQILVAEPV